MENLRTPPEGPPLEAARPGVSPRGGDDLARGLDVVCEAARFFAHDLKNPLSALLLGLQRLARMADPGHQPQAQTLVGRLEGTIQSMDRLVETLADLARLEQGGISLERTRQPAGVLIARAVEEVRSVAAGRRQRLSLDLPPELPELEVDAGRMTQALRHLLGRAMSASPEDAEVRCGAASAPGEVVVTVTATPRTFALPPTPPDAIPELCRARGARDLGVVIARGLAELHGGRLDVEEGPTFRLTLPSAPPAR